MASIPELTKKARQRLRWFDYYQSHGQNAHLSCRHFDISPQTFYRWKRRYNARHLESTEEFYEITDSTFEIEYLKEELLAWEHRYNTVRPHQVLGYLTPLKFLEQQDYGKEALCH